MTSALAVRPSAATRVLAVIAMALALVPALVLGSAAPARAHASILSIDPVPDWVYDDAPDEVSLTFNEPVSVELGGIRVFGPSGERVDGPTQQRDGDTTVWAPIEASDRGTYTVAWSVVSVDSHVLSSTLVFHVGEPTGTAADIEQADAGVVGVLGWLARWAIFTGMIALGGLVLSRLALRFALVGRRARVVAVSAAGLMLIGSVVKMAVQATSAAGVPVTDVFALGLGPVLDTRAGVLDGIRVIAAGVALAGALLWRRVWGAWLAGVATVTVMATLAVLGHAWTAEPPIAAASVDLVHQLAVTVWVGGLVALVVLDDRTQMDAAIRRFSRVALWALLAVVLSGFASALWQTAANPTTLFTEYGVLLLVKIALVGVMALLGWWQRRRLARAVHSAGRLLTGVRAEIVVAAVVLAITAVLVATVPARESLAPQPYTVAVAEDFGTVDVTVEPAIVGDNVVTMQFTDRVGTSRGVDVAQLTVSQGDLPPRAVTLTALAPDRWAAIDVSLPTDGEWTFELTTLSRGEESTVTFTVPIRGVEESE
ncbi:copper resistance CopC/CopD family protein [Microbacterium hominis]|uniref:Copper resistance protein CopC/CopD n=1 Tax=Microbacterium hominis TaxID=162426 RepID=A0A7D4UH87_9MICO|nr:copper resistance protein CopC [Microbacterium hominis]QKJ18228.1 copper resistance protein CopC/CopD [Microbacterium hominis]